MKLKEKINPELHKNPEPNVNHKSQISDELANMLNEQKDNELYNFQLYTEMANWFKLQGLSTLCKYYTKRAEEEIHHYKWIINKMNECNAEISHSPLTIKEKWNDNFKPFDITVIAEYNTTESLTRIAKHAFDENNMKIYNFIVERMIKEQQEEESLSVLVQKIANQDCDWLTKEQAIYNEYKSKSR